MSARSNVHATGVVLGRTGLLLRGPSGAGKSTLTLALMERQELQGRTARLVSDDRVDLESTPRGLVMHAPPRIAGLIELRGRGIVTRPHVDHANVHLVVDLVPTLERMVEEDEFTIEIMGVALPRCPVPQHGVAELGHQLLLVGEALRALATNTGAPRQKTT